MYSADIVECYQGNLGFVHQIARKCYGRLLDLEASTQYDDVFADVREAFLLAHAKFDPSKGFAFTTYFGTAAYNRINRKAESSEEERENGVFSIEGMGDDESSNLLETVPSDAMTPEEILDRQQCALQIEKAVQGMSPLAALIVEWIVSPPAALLEEIRKNQAHCDYSRSIGIRTRCAAGVNIGFICKFIRLVKKDVGTRDMAAAAQEVRRIIDTL
jgi:hypothetical protein